MLRRYLSVFKKHLIWLIVIVALIIVSSLTRGRIANITAIATGIVMIYAGISFVIWIVKTPAKKDKDEAA
jgi:beta-lactamase regulating signal transducer with metallopeptidase domain